MNNKGLAADRLFLALMGLFVLTIIYVFFDPLIEDKLYTGYGVEQTDAGSTPRNILDKYMAGWHWWLPMFLLAILIYAATAGRSRRTPYGAYGGQ